MQMRTQSNKLSRCLRQILPAIALALVCATCCGTIRGAVADDISGVVNVKAYGAKGDGAADDTAAIKAAVDAAAMQRSAPSTVGPHIQCGPVLVFPAGKYVINESLLLDSVLEVRGEGRPILLQNDNKKDIFVSTYAWRLSIKNLTFSGGRNQIDLSNPNLNTGQIVVESCRFYGAAEAAIRNKVTSTTIKISDCEFIRCHQTWINTDSDQSIMLDCWIEPATMGDYAAIEHHKGMMTIENVLGCPPDGSPKRRWIDNHGEWLTARRFRFGGENAGMTPVYQYRKYTPTILDRAPWDDLGASLILDDCFIVANGSEAECAVYCLELPNTLRITNSTLCTGIPAVKLDPKIDLNKYFFGAGPGVLSYSVDGTIGSGVASPKGLSNPMVRPKR